MEVGATFLGARWAARARQPCSRRTWTSSSQAVCSLPAAAPGPQGRCRTIRRCRAVDREDAYTVLIASGFGAASQSYRQRPHSRFRAELFLTRCAARCVQPASASPNTANPSATRWPRSRRTRQRILSASGFRNRPTTHHQWRMSCGQPTSTDHRSTRSSTISATYRRVDVFQGERWPGLVRAPGSPLRQGTSCCVVASFGWRGSWREVGIRRRRQTFG